MPDLQARLCADRNDAPGVPQGCMAFGFLASEGARSWPSPKHHDFVTHHLDDLCHD